MTTGMETCGFCNTGAHGTCPGGVRNGNGTIYLCRCGCPKSGVPHCTECGATQDLNDTWRCTDPLGCVTRSEQRALTDPALQRMRAARIPKEGIPVVTGGPTAHGRARQTRTPARAHSGICKCCGQPTKGGEFLPGHDSRYRANLLKGVTT
jgi:hypothetical protein